MSSTIGGIATFLRDFVRLAPQDLDIEVIGATSDARERPVGRWQAWDVGSRSVPFLPLVHAAPADHLSRFPVSLRFTLALAARRSRQDPNRTLQFHRPEVPLAFLRHRGPQIQLIHIDVQGGPQATRWRRIPVIYHAVENIAIPRMDRVFVANHAGVRLYRERYPERSDRIQFLSGWYNDAIFFPASPVDREEERRQLLADLGVAAAAGSKQVLYVGRLEGEKDPLLAVEAFARLHAGEDTAGRTGERAGAAHLVVVGEGSLRTVMEHRAAAAGVGGLVQFVGPRQQDVVAGLMRSSDALLVTSRSEGGGPRVVVEALACGLPVVSTVVGEVEGVVSKGRNGWLAHDRTPETLAAALRAVLELPRDAATAASVAAAQPFAAATVLATLYEAHRQIAGGAERRAGADRAGHPR